MGGGSSNDEKTNEINQQAFENLQNQVNHKNKVQQNLRQSKVISNKNSPKNSPRNNQLLQESKQKFSPRNSQPTLNNQLNQIQRQNRASGLKPQEIKLVNKDSRNDNNGKNNNSFEEKQQFQNIFINENGKYEISIQIFKLTPNVQPPHFQFLNQISSTYQGYFKWSFESKTKNWIMHVEQPQTDGISFNTNSSGQILKGDAKKWLMFNPSFSNQPKIYLNGYFYQRFVVQIKDQREQFFSPSFAKLKSQRSDLCRLWNEQQTECFAQFKNPKIKQNTTDKQRSQSQYFEVKRYFNKYSNEWQLTVFVEQKNHEFNFVLVQKIVDQNDKLKEIIEKQKRMLDLKKQIYIHKMNLLKS